MAPIHTAFQPSILLIKPRYESSSFPHSNSADAVARRGRIFSAGVHSPLMRTNRSGTEYSKIYMSGNSSSEDYQRFDELLGKTGSEAPIAPKKASTKSLSNNLSTSNNPKESIDRQEQYDQFSEMLGLEDRPKLDTEAITESTTVDFPRKIELNPQDYEVFDSLLAMSGGVGKKPTKGGKRYRTKVEALTEKDDRLTPIDDDEGIISLDDLEEQHLNPALQERPAFLTKEETAQAYAIMRENFGTGMHSPGVEILSEDDDENDEASEEPAAILMQPPMHPKPRGKVSKIADNTESPNPGRENRDSVVDSPALRAPPMRPTGSKVELAETKKEKVTWRFDETHCTPAEPADGEFFPDPLMPKPKRPGASEVTTLDNAGIGLGKHLQEIPSIREEGERDAVVEPLKAPPVRPTKLATERTLEGLREAVPEHDKIDRKETFSREAGINSEILLTSKPKRAKEFEVKATDAIAEYGGGKASVDPHVDLEKHTFSTQETVVSEEGEALASPLTSEAKIKEEQVVSPDMRMQLMPPPDRDIPEQAIESDTSRERWAPRKAPMNWQGARAGIVSPNELKVGSAGRTGWDSKKVVDLENPKLMQFEEDNDGFTEVEVIE